MSNDADNQVEQWLQAYSRKRREGQGQPPAMHEATRQMLQAEVARTWRQPQSAQSSGWEVMLWRWALGSAVAAVVVIAATLSWFGPGQKKNDGAVAKNSQPAQPASQTIQPTQPDPLLRAEAGRASGDAAIPALALALADGGAEDKKKELTADRRGTMRAASASVNKAAATQGATGAGFGGAGGGGPVMARRLGETENLQANGQASQVRQHFYRNDSQVNEGGKRNNAAYNEVLAEFELQRDGNQVQLRERDGSVYSGQVLYANEQLDQNLPLAAVGLDPARMMAALPAPKKGGLGGVVGPVPPAPVNPPPAGGLRPPVATPVVPVTPAAPEAQVVLPNDNIAGSLPVTELGRMVFGHNLRATSETAIEQGLPNFHGKSVWWDVTTGVKGEVTISTRGSNFDTTLGVFDGAKKPLFYANNLPVANDNVADAPSSEVRFEGVANKRYLIAVDGAGGATGKIQLMVRQDANKTGQLVAALPADQGVFYFQVAGTNRATQQRVEFAGYMLNNVVTASGPGAPSVLATATTPGAGARADFKGAARKADLQQAQSYSTQSRVVGRARVGKNELAIQADGAVPIEKAGKPAEKR